MSSQSKQSSGCTENRLVLPRNVAGKHNWYRVNHGRQHWNSMVSSHMTKASCVTYRGLSGRALGAAKSAARKCCLTLDEWMDLRLAGLRRCFRCKKWQPINSFCVDVTRKSGTAGSCKQCASNASKRSIYGLSQEHLDSLLSSPCEICGRTDRRIDIDHCHNTGVVRGGICESCNRGLGLLGDTAEAIGRALMYLRKEQIHG